MFKKNLIGYDMKTIKTVFLSGMNLSSLTSEYCDNPDHELELFQIGEKNADVDEILKHFNEINISLKDKMYIEKAEEIFKCIPMKMEFFYDKFEKEFMNVPIFKYYDSYQLFQRLSCANNEDIVSIKELISARFTKHYKELELEVKSMKQLKQVIEDYIKGKDTTIKIVMLKEFSREIATILERYKVKQEFTNEEVKTAE